MRHWVVLLVSSVLFLGTTLAHAERVPGSGGTNPRLMFSMQRVFRGSHYGTPMRYRIRHTGELLVDVTQPRTPGLLLRHSVVEHMEAKEILGMRAEKIRHVQNGTPRTKMIRTETPELGWVPELDLPIVASYVSKSGFHLMSLKIPFTVMPYNRPIEVEARTYNLGRGDTSRWFAEHRITTDTDTHNPVEALKIATTGVLDTSFSTELIDEIRRDPRSNSWTGLMSGWTFSNTRNLWGKWVGILSQRVVPNATARSAEEPSMPWTTSADVDALDYAE